MRPNTCDGCKFFALGVRINGEFALAPFNDLNGECRKSSPGSRGFPRCAKNDWCNEWLSPEQPLPIGGAAISDDTQGRPAGYSIKARVDDKNPAVMFLSIEQDPYIGKCLTCRFFNNTCLNKASRHHLSDVHARMSCEAHLTTTNTSSVLAEALDVRQRSGHRS